jgi:hypothetical protein
VADRLQRLGSARRLFHGRLMVVQHCAHGLPLGRRPANNASKLSK